MHPPFPTAQPRLRARPPASPAWQHEVKFDGYRIHIHKDRDRVRILSKNGYDLSTRLAPLTRQVATLPCRSVVIDAEAVAVRADGRCDFHALHLRTAAPDSLVAYCFDLLLHDGCDWRPRPLLARRERLQALLAPVPGSCLIFSEAFDDGAALLAACEARGLEGIVSKRMDAPYRAPKCDWIKVKCSTWRMANQQRFRMFERRD